MLIYRFILLSISLFWLWWGLYMISLGIIYVICLINEDVENSPSNKKKYHLKSYELNVTKARFINLIIDWCKKNMEFPKHHKYYPTVEIKYYKNKKLGDYLLQSRKITIYVNNHLTIEELVDTCIHEYTHYLQMPKVSQQLEYTKYNKTKGYFNNPYEIDAREKAKFYTPKCIKDFKKLGYIS